MNKKYCLIIQIDILPISIVNINAYTKFDRNPQINSQDIELNQNSDVDEGP